MTRPPDVSPPDASAPAALWRARSEADRDDPRSCARVAEQLLAAGEPLVAHDLAREGLERHPSDARLRELIALALARAGATRRALEALEALRHDGSVSEETLGLLARIHKDLAQQAASPGERARHLREARTLYETAHAAGGGHWTGINTATMLLLTGERERARAIARDVRSRCIEVLAQERPGDDRFWLLATLGESALVLGEDQEALDRYARASETAAGRWADVASARRQAGLIADHLGLDRARLDPCFRLPRVTAFVGHMIDRPERVHPRFPPELEGVVREQIRAELDRLGIGFGYASAACGSDILFLEAVLDRSGEVTVVLPYDRDQFIEDSVDIVPGSGWSARCRNVLSRACRCFTVLEQRVEWGSLSYEYASSLVLGFAAVRARQLETDLVGLAVWDGRAGDAPGGTAAAVEAWRRLGHRVEVIDLGERLRGRPVEVAGADGAGTPSTSRAAGTAGSARTAGEPESFQVMSMLFADAIGFSKLTERQVYRFVDSFLPAVAGVLRTSAHQPVVRNTWGDGLYLVFSDARAAGLLALELVERTGRTEWRDVGLPARLDFRVALHVGPVLGCVNPGFGSFPTYHVRRPGGGAAPSAFRAT